jgi:hypothetical protein
MFKNSKFSRNMIQSYDAPYGVGPSKKLFIDFDEYIDTSNYKKFHNEIVYALSIIDQNEMRWAKFVGNMPEGHYPDSYVEDQYLTEANISEEEEKIFQKLNIQQRRKYLYFTKNILKPWAFTVYLREGNFNQKTQQHGNDWNSIADYFPLTKEFISTLPFTSIGRVMLFCTDAYRDVPVHRDHLPKTHYDHNINFFFDRGRKTYIYNPISKEKFYLNQNCKSYFFNNRDFHGVDSESYFRYTLRVDGTFNKEIIKKIELYDDGAVMKESND